MKRYPEDTPNHTFWFPSLGIPPLSTPYNHPKRTDNPLYNNVYFYRWLVFSGCIEAYFTSIIQKTIFYHTANYPLSKPCFVTPNTKICHSKLSHQVSPQRDNRHFGAQKKETISLPYKNNCRMVIFSRSNAILIYSPTLPSYSLK